MRGILNTDAQGAASDMSWGHASALALFDVQDSHNWDSQNDKKGTARPAKASAGPDSCSIEMIQSPPKVGGKTAHPGSNCLKGFFLPTPEVIRRRLSGKPGPEISSIKNVGKSRVIVLGRGPQSSMGSFCIGTGQVSLTVFSNVQYRSVGAFDCFCIGP